MNSTVQQSNTSWDIQAAYVGISAYVASLVALVICGPDLMLGLASRLIVLAIAFLVLVLLARIVDGAGRLPRVIPLVLLLSCLVLVFTSANMFYSDLFVMSRVYFAGGPNVVNEWGQQWIRDYKGQDHVEPDEEEIPSQIRKHLSGWVGTNTAADVLPPTLRLELGGGFFHFGLLILPTEKAPRPEWWHKFLDWPPELIVYHDED